MQRQLPQYPALPTMVDYGWEIKSAGSRWFEIFQKNIKNEMTHESLSSVQLLSRVLTLCDPMNRSTPGLPVHHQLPEPTQTHVHQVGDAIQPSHPLSFPFPPALNLSQHQGPLK